MEIHCGSDHRGFELKGAILEYLRKLGHDCHDQGCYNAERVDYPIFAHAVSNAVVESPGSIGIVVCGSGIGVSIAANKVIGARCAQVWCEHTAEYARRHNHANILAFGSDLQTFTQVQRCLDAYLGAEEESGRHADRVKMLES